MRGRAQAIGQVGLDVHRAARVAAAGHGGGQIVLSAAARFGEAGDRDAVAYARSAAAEALARLGFTSDAAVLAAVVERIRTQLGLAGSTAEQA